MITALITVMVLMLVVYKLDLQLDYAESEDLAEDYDIIVWYSAFWTRDNERRYIILF